MGSISYPLKRKEIYKVPCAQAPRRPKITSERRPIRSLHGAYSKRHLFDGCCAGI